MSVLEEHLGPDGLMQDPDLLHSARRHWARYFGQFMPQEIVRATIAGRHRYAIRAARIYLENVPETLFGTACFAAKRIISYSRNS
jgi:hypothetical protein